jgi:hypothetical protein
MRSCMIYWVVFSLFTLSEALIDALMSWVPLYSIARVGLQVWLFTHNFAGAAVVYNAAVVPLLSKVDAFVELIEKELMVKPTEKHSSK